MTCHEIANQLPAYQEDILPPEEKKSIEGHLASCSCCRRALADLKKAKVLIQDLGEVDPPPFFEQRIMSQVREEAGKKRGILRMLFYPLHVKIPIQAVSTLFVVVLAFYVYQQGEPEMKHLASPPRPLTELGKGQVTVESPQAASAPSAGTQAKQTPIGKPSEKERQQFVFPPPESVGQADRMEDSWDKDKMADIGGAAGERKKVPSAPVLSKLKTAATMKQSTIVLTIQVSDMSVAVREIEKRLDQAGALVIERRRQERGEYLKADIPAQNIAVFLERLEAIGRIEGEKRPLADPDGKVTVILQIAGENVQ